MVLLVLFYILLFAVAVTLDFWVGGLIRAFGPSCRVVLLNCGICSTYF